MFSVISLVILIFIVSLPYMISWFTVILTSFAVHPGGNVPEIRKYAILGIIELVFAGLSVILKSPAVSTLFFNIS